MWSTLLLVPIIMCTVFILFFIIIGLYRRRILKKYGPGVLFWPHGHCDNRCYTVYITDPRIFPPGSTYPIRTPDAAYPGCFQQQPYFPQNQLYPSRNPPPRPPPPYRACQNVES